MKCKLTNRSLIRRIPANEKAKQLIAKINDIMKSMHTNDVTDLNELVYAAALTIEEEMIEKKKGFDRPNNLPPWKRRLMSSIETLRKDVNRLMAFKKNEGRLHRTVYEKYHLYTQGINHAIEDAKQRLIALSSRLRRYEARNEQFKINALFRTNQRKVFKNFRNERKNEEREIPNREETKDFWEKLWSKPARHNEAASWISDLEEDTRNIPRQQKIIITEGDVRNKIAGMANWKAPGHDKVQTFWLKKFTSVHKMLAHQFNNLIKHPQNIPQWLVKGRTVLIRKNPEAQPTPDNYRPITCLPTIWKVFTGILANKIMEHAQKNQILCHEQKGIRPAARGTKDQLAIDRTVAMDNKSRHTNLTMAWIDYKKAYDSIPHSWILRCLQLYKIDENIQAVIHQSMKLWKTTLTHDKEEIADIQIRRGIFQGDALSPLLFCLALNPLSHILRKEGKEYTMKSGEKINHLLYMDDLKLYIVRKRTE